MSEMSNYFGEAEQKKAILLDASNYCREYYPILSSMSNSLDQIKSLKFDLGYDDPAGSIGLKKIIAEYESGIEGITIQPSNVIINSGGVTGTFDQVFRYLFREYLVDGRNEVIIPIPAYPEIYRSVIYNGLSPVLVATDFKNGFQPTVKEIEPYVSEKTSCIFLTSPGNPCCKYISQKELKNMVELTKDKNTTLVLDAIFEEATNNPLLPNFLSSTSYSKLVKIKGPSKDRPHMNDVRVGWSISLNPEINKGMYLASEVAGFSISLCLNNIVQSEMALRLDKQKYETNFKSFTELNGLSSELSVYLNEISSFHNTIKEGTQQSINLCLTHPSVEKVCIPEAGNIIFAQINEGCATRKAIQDDHDLFYYFLNKNNVGVTPGHMFHLPKEDLWFRTTMSIKPEKFIHYLKSSLDSLI
jgi:aspartate/methionine/tyrosine aminotransferase